MQQEIKDGKEKETNDAKTVILRVDSDTDKEYDTVDLVNVAVKMKEKRRFYFYLLVTAVCAGFIVAAVSLGIQGIFGGKSYAGAVVSFNFDGIDEGMDPSGGLFDVTKLKSTEVINRALQELGWEAGKVNVEKVRANLKLEGVIPDSVKQQIAVINTVAADAAEYYTTIEDLDYFPSQYTVTLSRCKGMSGNDTR